MEVDIRRMEQELRSRRSKEEDFRTFASEFDRIRPEMARIICDLLNICEQMRKRKKNVPAKAVGASVGAGALAGVVAVTFTAAFSLLATTGLVAAAGAAAAGAVLLYDQISDRETLDQVKTLLSGLFELVQPLKDIQNRKTEMLTKLDRECKEVEDIIKQMKSLRGVYIIFTSDSTVQRLLEVTQLCKNILKELEEVRGIIRHLLSQQTQA